mmetsp:Transcript_12660/g.20677  ORF Transcript_12660/g.20677 Transcript_12660/m.20677 type:complete len:185 (-) Transcript_12660:92-646(-)
MDYSLDIRTSMPSSSTDIVNDTGSSSGKSVRFAPTATRRNYRNKSSWDSEESLWYSDSDYKGFEVDRAVAASRISGCSPIAKDGLNDDDIEECFWGLERLMIPGLRERTAATRARIIEDVCAERKHQLSMRSGFNPDAISIVLSDHSKWSAEMARKKALFHSSPLFEGESGGFDAFLVFLRWDI